MASCSTPVNYPIQQYCMSGNTKPVADKYLKQVLSVFKGLEVLSVLKGLEIVPPVQEAQKQKTFQDSDIQEALTYLNGVLVMNQSLLQRVKKQFDDITKIDENVMERLKKLKECLLKFIGFLDEILLFYSDMNSVVRIQPSIDDVKKSTEELKNILIKMKPKELPALLSNVKPTKEEILCSVVGLQNCVAQRLASLDSDVRDHQTDMYFLIRFFSDHCESTEVNLTDKKAVASKLQEMGFTESRSKMVASWIANQPMPGHRPLLSWVERYVENIFKYDIFLNESVSSYPHEDNKVNEWFDVPVKEYHGREVVTTVDVPFFNTTYDKASETVIQKVQESGLECWFHGTDHKAATNIVENGIIFGEGEKSLDFSHGDGFYLNPDGQKAVKWLSMANAGAVIIFKAAKASEFNCLDLETNAERWKEVVKWNRSGKNRNKSLDEDLETEYSTCDYIRGPMAKDGAGYPRAGWESQLIDGDICIRQICVKSKRMAAAIGKPGNILGVVCWNSISNTSCNVN